MGGWVLILTILASGNNGRGGVSMATVDSFLTQEACVQAAEIWKRDANANAPSSLEVRLSAVCAPKAKP